MGRRGGDILYAPDASQANSASRQTARRKGPRGLWDIPTATVGNGADAVNTRPVLGGREDWRGVAQSLSSYFEICKFEKLTKNAYSYSFRRLCHLLKTDKMNKNY